MNTREYTKSLFYRYRLNKDKAISIKMRHNLWKIKKIGG